MAQTNSLINEKVFNARFKEMLNTEMVGAAEPIIQKALSDIEGEMRKKVASLVVAFIDKDVDLNTCSDILTIRIRNWTK